MDQRWRRSPAVRLVADAFGVAGPDAPAADGADFRDVFEAVFGAAFGLVRAVVFGAPLGAALAAAGLRGPSSISSSSTSVATPMPPRWDSPLMVLNLASGSRPARCIPWACGMMWSLSPCHQRTGTDTSAASNPQGRVNRMMSASGAPTWNRAPLSRS